MDSDMFIVRISNRLPPSKMYRTLKSTDHRVTAVSGHEFDAFENGSSGDTTSDYLLIDIQNSNKSELVASNQYNKDYHCLWSNSSREAWLHGSSRDCDGKVLSFEKDMEPRCSSYDMITEVSSSSISERTLLTPAKKPNLEFTLGL